LGEGVEMAQIMYTHVSKYKNNKIKFKKKNLTTPSQKRTLSRK
jgi:hypothetical protein